MYPQAGLTYNEVLPVDKQGKPNPKYPKDRKCKSGHLAPEGARFFIVSGPVLDRSRWGTYCQTCLRIAHKLAEKREQQEAVDGE